MTPVIQAGVIYHNTTPAMLYELFMDSDKHSAATGAPAKISRKVGGKWSAFDGMICGKNLALFPSQMIVQTWRSTSWKKVDHDSILVVRFEKYHTGARVELAHIGVPEYDHKGVTQGWKKYYWEPWKKYLNARKTRARVLVG
jgi:activator of HSP90 ATPase